MKLKTLTIEKLTVFDAVSFHFAPGVNVFIGENATGKSHVLKLLYVLNEAIRRTQKSHAGNGGVEHFATLEDAAENLLRQTFLPDGSADWCVEPSDDARPRCRPRGTPEPR